MPVMYFFYISIRKLFQCDLHFDSHFMKTVHHFQFLRVEFEFRLANGMGHPMAPDQCNTDHYHAFHTKDMRHKEVNNRAIQYFMFEWRQ